MKKHSISIQKKRDFIAKHRSLPENVVVFYTKLFTAQESSFDILQQKEFKVSASGENSYPFIEPDNLRLEDDVVGELAALLDKISEIIIENNPGMDFSLLAASFKDVAGEALVKFLQHDFDYFESKASVFRLDVSELIFMLHNVFRPLMNRARLAADFKVNREEWLEGYCPFCGYIPDFAKIVESKDNMRKLHCSLCEFEWEFPRLQCHSCGTDDQSVLGFFEYEDDPDYRIYYCDSCRSYIKSIRIPKLKEESSADLAVEDVITGFLDATMMEKNYNRS